MQNEFPEAEFTLQKFYESWKHITVESGKKKKPSGGRSVWNRAEERQGNKEQK